MKFTNHVILHTISVFRRYVSRLINAEKFRRHIGSLFNYSCIYITLWKFSRDSEFTNIRPIGHHNVKFTIPRPSFNCKLIHLIITPNSWILGEQFEQRETLACYIGRDVRYSCLFCLFTIITFLDDELLFLYFNIISGWRTSTSIGSRSSNWRTSLRPSQ